MLELWRLERAERLGEDEDHEYTGEDLQLGGHVPSGIFPGPPSLRVAKVAAFWNLKIDGENNHGLAQESHIYSLIRDASIAPRFLAHLTDNQERIIGYVSEHVPARTACIGDVDLCRAALQKLHSLGIAHGRLSRDAFLLRQDIPVAQMRSFFSAYETTNPDVFDKEMSCLEEVLQQPPPPVPVGYEQLTAFWERDGWVHPVLFSQMKHDGQITISPEDHRAMLADLEKKDWRCTPQDVQDDVDRLRRNGGKWN